MAGAVRLPSKFNSYAKGKKGPKDGQYCSKKAVGTTATDKAGNTLTCKADSKGKPRWTK